MDNEQVGATVPFPVFFAGVRDVITTIEKAVLSTRKNETAFHLVEATLKATQTLLKELKKENIDLFERKDNIGQLTLDTRG